jgi:hypothetical protein
MIGPRSPAQRDLRFKHVQLASNLQGSLITDVSAIIPGNSSAIQATDDLGPPLAVGNQNCGTINGVTSCGWRVYEYSAPVGVPGFNSVYGVDALTNLGSDLASSGGNSVMTSLDEQTESGLVEDIFAYSVETDPTVSNGFTVERAQATDATLATTVSAMAAKGVVVSAVSANSSGGIDLVAYAWTGDAGTAYDAQTVLTSYTNVGPQALGLAQGGYIVTAVSTADAQPGPACGYEGPRRYAAATSSTAQWQETGARPHPGRSLWGTYSATTPETIQTCPASRRFWPSRYRNVADSHIGA